MSTLWSELPSTSSSLSSTTTAASLGPSACADKGCGGGRASSLVVASLFAAGAACRESLLGFLVLELSCLLIDSRFGIVFQRSLSGFSEL